MERALAYQELKVQQKIFGSQVLDVSANLEP